MKKLLAIALSTFVLLGALLSFNLGLYKVDMSNIANADLTATFSKGTITTNTYDENFLISVMGEATKSVVPDMAKICASIETLDMDMKKSKDINFETFEKVLNALEEIGISKDKIILDSFSSYPNYDYNAGKTLTGYYSTTTFTIDVENLDNVKNIVDTITENGVTGIRNINYEVSNLNDIYNEVLEEALENAKIKAQKLTQRESLSLVNIKEESTYSVTNLYKTYSQSLENSSLIGQIDIHAKVVVNFS